MKIYVIIKDSKYDDYELIEKPESSYFSLVDDKSAYDESESWGLKSYTNRHGYHFTDQLAQVASDMMINSNGKSHKWTPEQIEKTMKMYGLKCNGKCTLGDLTYLANMAYADLYPSVLKDEVSCLRYAVAMAEDPDGYDGMIFNRWLSDLKKSGRENRIQWEKYY